MPWLKHIDSMTIRWLENQRCEDMLLENWRRKDMLIHSADNLLNLFQFFTTFVVCSLILLCSLASYKYIAHVDDIVDVLKFQTLFACQKGLQQIKHSDQSLSFLHETCSKFYSYLATIFVS